MQVLELNSSWALSVEWFGLVCASQSASIKLQLVFDRIKVKLCCGEMAMAPRSHGTDHVAQSLNNPFLHSLPILIRSAVDKFVFFKFLYPSGPILITMNTIEPIN